MSINSRLVAFGTVSGLIWSLIVFHVAFGSGGASEPGDTSELVFLAILMALGIATGIAISYALRGPLARCGLLSSLALGLLALPLGAFIFGFGLGLVDVIYRVAGARADNALQCAALPFVFGFYGAMLSASMYYLLPIAILTTFLLRVVIRLGKRTEGTVELCA